MKFTSIPKFKDVRNSLRKHSWKRYVNVGVFSKTHIIIHHSLTTSGSAEAYANYHVGSLGWCGIGYHFVIEKDGTVKFCNDVGLKTYHVGNHNSYAVGICLTGDFRTQKPTKEQEESLRNLVRALQSDYPRLKTIKGHNELSGYEWKACPVFDFRAVLAVKSSSPTKPVVKSSAVHVIQEGDTLWSIANGGDVTVEELKAWNGIADPTELKIGQVVVIRKPVESSRYTVKKGDTLYDIARDKGVTLQELQSANPKVDAKTMSVGTELVIPKAVASKPVASKPAPKPAPKPKYTVPTGTLRTGDKGTKVKQLQTCLNAVKYKVGTADGIYGAKTADAVKRFQSMYGVKPFDGIYGSKTRSELVEQMKKKGLI